MRNKRSRYAPPRQLAQKRKYSFSARYIGITAVFLLICLFFVIKLYEIQSSGTPGSLDDNGLVTRTYTVAGVRGEIYDRNGKLLVGNSINYDIVFEYGTIPDTTPELNRAILDVLEAMEKTDSLSYLADDLYPLEGVYPNLHFTSEAKDTSSETYSALLKIFDSNKLGDADDVSEELLTDALRRKYKMYEDQYTPEEITALLRIRYEMERVQFGYYNPYAIANNVPRELVSYLQESGADGINFKINAERVYYYGGYASHILGRVGKIQAEDAEKYSSLGYSLDAVVGNSGCEKAFEEYLHSQDGVMTIVYDENGSIVEKKYDVTPISGNDVWLTIDIDMQIAAEDTLADTIGLVGSANAGAAVTLDPNSGAIYAIASYPTFDLTQMQSIDYYNSLLADENLPELNRALSGVYPPGSVYKIGAALAALEENKITSTSEYTCNKVFPHLHGPTCLGNHGSITVTDAIKDSCNVFFYYLGMEMGIDNITRYTKPLGLGVSTGIELPERVGIVAGKANAGIWDAGNDLSAAIGQANHGYTPLQMAVYTASLTNGGSRYEAHLLDSVHEFYTGNIIYKQQPKIAETVEMNAYNKNIVLEGMRRVVESNATISSYFKGVPVTVGGKTGTAQVNGKADYALFAGAAPYDNPEIVGVCIIEEGAMGTNASRTVAKVFETYYDKRQDIQQEIND